jgi:hypothetical protein
MLIMDRTKWLGVVLGVLLATFLITHLLSMFTGMMARTYATVSDIPYADIWVMDPAVEYVDEPAGLPDTALLLYVFTMENLPHYATLYAMGAPRRTLITMIAIQALFSGATGYGLGIGASVLMSKVIRTTAMPYELKPKTLAFSAIMVIAVSLIASILSARRVAAIEPGLIFQRR